MCDTYSCVMNKLPSARAEQIHLPLEIGMVGKNISPTNYFLTKPNHSAVLSFYLQVHCTAGASSYPMLAFISGTTKCIILVALVNVNS